MRLRILAATVAAAAPLALVASSASPVTAGSTTAAATVFSPNPVADLQNESLTDQKDTDYAALQAAYHQVTLTHLDGTGTLSGDYAHVASDTGKPAQAVDGTFFYHRDVDQLEQVMAYYWTTEAH